MTTIQVARPNQLGELYDEILARSFPSDELVDRGSFLHNVTWGEVLVTENDEGVVTGIAVADLLPDTRVAVLEYLAVAPEFRGDGAGLALFEAAVAEWQLLVSPGAVFAEMARPNASLDEAEFGDPQRRLAFYERLGLKGLVLPYYQPALVPEQRALPDLILGVLVLDPSWLSPDGTRFVETARLAEAIQSRMPSPPAAERAAWEALLAAVSNPAGIEVVPLGEYSRIPRSVPIG